MTAVVSDTSPIRALHHLGLTGLLGALFGEVLIPPAVAAELTAPESGLVPIPLESLAGVRLRAPSDRSRVGQLLETLDAGESEALALALEVRASVVLMDEEDGRTEAVRLGLTPVGALGILVRGKQAGRVAQVAPLISRLQDELGFFVSDRLRQAVLRSAGESDSSG